MFVVCPVNPFKILEKSLLPNRVFLLMFNRFVIETCRHLKEHKSYLLWNAIGCLGVSVVKDLVKEVCIS